MIQKKLKKLIKSPIRFFEDAYLKRIKLKKAHDDDVYLQLEKFIADYDVNSIKWHEEYIWPYLRNHIWAAINSISIGQYQDYKLTPQRIQGGHPYQLPNYLYHLLEKKYHPITRENMPTEQVDILFFVMQNAVEQQVVNGDVYHKIIDPYYTVAKNITTAKKVEIIRTRRLSHHWNDYVHPVQLLLLPQDLDDKHIDDVIFDNRLFYKMKQHLTLLKPLNKKTFLNLISYELSARAFYLEFLKKIKPKIIFLNYFHRYAPLISAADELGIITVDLQHGLQAGWGMLYNHYPEITGKSYQAYPDYFAVWSEDEAKHIKETFQSTSKHQPIVMGNAWLSGFSQTLPSLTPKLKRSIDTNKFVVLVILQKQMVVPKWLTNLIDSSDDTVQWLIRHHPNGKQFKLEDFNENPYVLLSKEFDDAIPSQLDMVDVTLSEGSALSIEMCFLGIPSLIIGEKAKQGYVMAINKGWLGYLNPPPKSVNDIHKALKHVSVRSANFFDDIPPKKFINNLLKISEEI